MYFGNRFYTETVVSVTYINGLSVHQTDADAEQILVDVGKVGDVIGIFSPGVTLYLFIGFLGNLF